MTDAQTPAVVRNEPAEILRGVFFKQNNQFSFVIERARIVEACAKLREGGFAHLSSITAIDWKNKWEVVYHLVQYGRKDIVTLRVVLPYQDPRIPSVTGIWPGAGWHERESYDLMGIIFIGNPDLRRILLPEDFEGHPLRKEVKYGNTS